MSVANIVDHGHVVLFLKTMSSAYHPSDTVAIDLARRKHVYEVDIEVESANQRSNSQP